MILADVPTPELADNAAAETSVLRHFSGMLGLHGLCAHVACRRVRGCRGEPRDCLSRYAPLVPEDARQGAKAMVDGWRRGLGFDELIEEEEMRDDVMALAAWAGKVAASYRVRQRPSPRPPLDGNFPPGHHVSLAGRGLT